MSSHDDDQALAGDWGSVKYAKLPNGSMPSKVFISDLTKSDQRKLTVLLKRLATTGKINNRDRFRKERGKIFGLKSYQLRVACFQKGRAWYLTHGFIKKEDKWRDEELDRAEEILKNHIN